MAMRPWQVGLRTAGSWREGTGICFRFGDIIVANAIQGGLLVPLLEDWQELGSFPFWALHRPDRQRVPRVKAFMDFLAECFGGSPWRTRRGN